MISAVISRSATKTQDQLTLDFTPGLLDRFGGLRECVASGVYQRGLGKVAIDLNKAPGNLSVELSEDPARHFSVDSLERYIEKTGDTMPVMYLIERFLAPSSAPKNSEKLLAIRRGISDLQRQMDELGSA